MTKTIATLAFVCVLLGLTTPNAEAGVTLAYGDQYYIGSIKPGEPASDANEVSWVTQLIGMTNGTTDTTTLPGYTFIRSNNYAVSDLPTPVVFASRDTPAFPVTGYTYLLAKYDGPNGADLVWNISGLTVDGIPSNLLSSQGCTTGGCGLSHYTLFNPTSVPDGGVTLMLLGVGLVGIETLRRKLRV